MLLDQHWERQCAPESFLGNSSGLDLDAAELECPACGKRFANGPLRCPGCGLRYG